MLKEMTLHKLVYQACHTHNDKTELSRYKWHGERWAPLHILQHGTQIEYKWWIMLPEWVHRWNPPMLRIVMNRNHIIKPYVFLADKQSLLDWNLAALILSILLMKMRHVRVIEVTWCNNSIYCVYKNSQNSIPASVLQQKTLELSKVYSSATKYKHNSSMQKRKSVTKSLQQW